MSDDKRSEIDEKRSEVETETEDQANQPGRLAGTLIMFRDLWRVIRGQDERGRKVRWLLGLLRPYRLQVILMSVTMLVATAAALAPPYLAGKAIDSGIQDGNEGVLTDSVTTLASSPLSPSAETGK